jgi:hypothetical protein
MFRLKAAIEVKGLAWRRVDHGRAVGVVHRQQRGGIIGG